jgi:hypothetical protein
MHGQRRHRMGEEGETADGTGCADTVDTWLASQNVGNMIRCWILTDCRVRCCNKKGYARKRSRRLKTELPELPYIFGSVTVVDRGPTGYDD